MTTMLTTGEQQELCHIEQELRDADRGFAWRLAVLQGMLRWAGPGRRAHLPVLAVLAAALLRLAAAAGRLLMAFADGAMYMEPAAVIALGDAAWPGRDPGQAPSHSAGRQPGRSPSSASGSTAGTSSYAWAMAGASQRDSTAGFRCSMPLRRGVKKLKSQDMEAVMG